MQVFHCCFKIYVNTSVSKRHYDWSPFDKLFRSKKIILDFHYVIMFFVFKPNILPIEFIKIYKSTQNKIFNTKILIKYINCKKWIGLLCFSGTDLFFKFTNMLSHLISLSTSMVSSHFYNSKKILLCIWIEIKRIWWLVNDRNVLPWGILHYKWCVYVMQKVLALPLLR